MTIARRRFLGGGLAATVWAMAPALARASDSSSVADEFRILEAGPATERLLAESASETHALGYAGSTPGPLLRLRLGDTLKVRLVNKLTEPTTLHWRGMRLANAMAGISDLTQKAVSPGASFDYRFAPPDAGFGWYHPHAGAVSAEQVARGLYGPVVVDEASPPSVDLDAIVALQDGALFTADGQFDSATPSAPSGRAGKFLIANGAPAPASYSIAPRARVRLRLVNAAIARIMIVAVEGVKPTIVAIDGQPSEPFEPLRNLMPIGPGARFELVFDMPAEEDAAVRFILRGGAAAPLADEPDRPIVVFKAAGTLAAARPAFPGFGANPLLPKEIDLARALRADFALSGVAGGPLLVNGAALTTPWPAKPLLKAPKGSPVALTLVNKTSTAQALRWGGHVARLLHTLDDGWEPYWRDSALLAPGQTIHIAFVADNPGRWPVESAIFDSQVAGARSFFEVG
jgi:FtsP/CotA-like multicopper oxidase with cupredoxin domain